jgi:hypothetical protein
MQRAYRHAPQLAIPEVEEPIRTLEFAVARTIQRERGGRSHAPQRVVGIVGSGQTIDLDRQEQGDQHSKEPQGDRQFHPPAPKASTTWLRKVAVHD